MNDELQQLWQQQEPTMKPINPEALIASLKQRQQSERRRIVWLNVQELLPSFGLFGLLSWMAATRDTGRWAFTLAAVLCLGVGLFLLTSSLRQHRAESGFGPSMRGELERSLSQAEHRFRLYRTVGWWYLTPLALGIALIYLPQRLDSSGGPGLFDVTYVAAVAAMFGFLLRANRRIAFDRYQPEVTRYRTLLSELDDTATG